MKDYLGYVNDYISGALSPELMIEVAAKLTADEELQNEYRILLSSREYIKAKSMLVEIETDPGLYLAEGMVEKFINEKNGYRWINTRKRKYLVITIHVLSVLFLVIVMLIRMINSI